MAHFFKGWFRVGCPLCSFVEERATFYFSGGGHDIVHDCGCNEKGTIVLVGCAGVTTVEKSGMATTAGFTFG